jgi:hypothetical protein
MLDILSKEWHVLVPNLEKPSCVVLKLDGVFLVGIQDARMVIPRPAGFLKHYQQLLAWKTMSHFLPVSEFW